MMNLNSNAFPFEHAIGNIDTMGFSKHEYGALMIAQGLASKYTLSSPDDQKVIAQLAYELAGEVLEQFNK